MHRFLVLALVLGFALYLPVALAGDEAPAAPSADTVTKAIMEQWGKHKSVTGTLDWSASIALNPQAQPLNLVGGGTLTYLKQDTTPLSRLEIYARIAGGQSTNNLAEALVVYDGIGAGAKLTYFGNSEYPSFDIGGGEVNDQLLLNLLNKYFAMNAASEGEVDGTAAYILSGTPTFDLPENVPMASLKAYFSKETGVPIKIEIANPEGANIMTLVLKDVVLDGDVSADLFVVPEAPPAPEPTAAEAPDDSAETKAAPAAEEEASKKDSPKKEKSKTDKKDKK